MRPPLNTISRCFWWNLFNANVKIRKLANVKMEMEYSSKKIQYEK